MFISPEFDSQDHKVPEQQPSNTESSRALEHRQDGLPKKKLILSLSIAVRGCSASDREEFTQASPKTLQPSHPVWFQKLTNSCRNAVSLQFAWMLPQKPPQVVTKRNSISGGEKFTSFSNKMHYTYSHAVIFLVMIKCSMVFVYTTRFLTTLKVLMKFSCAPYHFDNELIYHKQIVFILSFSKNLSRLSIGISKIHFQSLLL